MRSPAGGTIGAVLGTAIADLLLNLLRPEEHRDRFALPVAAAMATMSVWSGHLLGFAVYESLRWPVVLWSGMVLITSMVATSLAFPTMLATSHSTDRAPAYPPAWVNRRSTPPISPASDRDTTSAVSTQITASRTRTSRWPARARSGSDGDGTTAS